MVAGEVFPNVMSQHHTMGKLPCYTLTIVTVLNVTVLTYTSPHLVPLLLCYRPSHFVTVHRMHTCSCITVDSDAFGICFLKLDNEGRIVAYILTGVSYMHITVSCNDTFSTYILNGVSYMRGHMYVDKT